MSLLKYLNNSTNEIKNKNTYLEYSHIISELKKEDKIDLLEYTYLNNFTKDQFITNIKWLIEILNKNLNYQQKVKIKDTFINLISIEENDLVVNKEIYDNLIHNDFIEFSKNQKKAIKKLKENNEI